jgi:hypothetical protein
MDSLKSLDLSENTISSKAHKRMNGLFVETIVQYLLNQTTMEDIEGTDANPLFMCQNQSL